MVSDNNKSGGQSAAGALQQGEREEHGSLEGGPFVLRPLLRHVPLSADGTSEEIRINCVDYLDDHLYVGTSASELLHFFQIPPDPADPSGSSTFILASRLLPAYSEATAAPNGSRPGVQQILLLPSVGKACVLCNWTVTFYSLPELSPVFGTTQVKNCNWIGGVDLNEGAGGDAGDHRPSGVTVLLSLNKRIRVVRIGEDARVVKSIDFAGSTLSVRRDNIACVADSRSYALLDVDRQLKIPLMSVSSLDNSQLGGPLGQAQNIATTSDGGLLRSASSATARPLLDAAHTQAHSRSTSLGGFISANIRRQESSRAGETEEPVFQEGDPSPTPPSRLKSPSPTGEQQDTGKPLPPPPPADARPSQKLPSSVSASASPARGASPSKPPVPVFLKPHIVSPTAEEFLLVTGTGPLDPGIGMFVNLDGDPTRPTLEFDRYPRELVVDGGGSDRSSDVSSSRPGLSQEEEGFVLASMTREFGDGLHHGLEIQRFDVNVGEGEPEKYWLEARMVESGQRSIPDAPLGVRSLVSSSEMQFREVVDRLCQRRFSPFFRTVEPAAGGSLRRMDSRVALTALSIERQSKEKALFERDLEADEESLPEGWEATRSRDEEDFARRLAKASSRLAVWAGDHIWWAVRNPLILQLEAGLEQAASSAQNKSAARAKEERKQLFGILDSIRGRDARTELEFMTFSYIRQRAGVMLLWSFLHAAAAEAAFTDAEVKAMEEVLIEGSLDPRVVLALVPALRNEIIENARGTWIYGGIKNVVESYMPAAQRPGETSQSVGSLPVPVLQFLRRFLAAWRRKKGFGSIADESEVFQTVDASLLLVLLELDKSSSRDPAVRVELYEIVDHGVDCFERAAGLLETYHRLFVLSRLYQSRKMAADVLGTWRRIMEGEEDAGDELGDGEQRVRGYLLNISNRALVQEYGVWLATRNPKLGVQVFADDKGKAPRFEHAQVVALLREEAPDAVKYYLEHLVFGKGNTSYVNELITHYLDIVINDLQSSPASRDTVTASYAAYRALRPPKPTYRQFLADNAPSADDEVWHSRLRLLQLLGGTHDYDVEAVAARIRDALPAASPDAQLLVPEAVILDGRAGRHDDALRLLVHRLGDYDSAAAYCLRAGPDSFTAAAAVATTSPTPTHETQARLFGVLLREFLALEDISDRVEQTGALLERFGGWFDVLEVLRLIPDGWSVDVAAGFLAAALRRLVRERHEAAVARALGSAENLRVSYERVLKIEEAGPVVVQAKTGGGGMQMDVEAGK